MSYRTAIPYCYRDPNGTYYFRLVLNKKLRILAPLLPKEVRLSLLTKRRQKAKELALSLAQASLSQQAVLVQMARKNAPSKDLLEQHLKNVEEQKRLIRMSTDEKLTSIPELVIGTGINTWDLAEHKSSLSLTIRELEQEVSGIEHGFIKKEKLRFLMSNAGGSFDEDNAKRLAKQKTKRAQSFVEELKEKLKVIEMDFDRVIGKAAEKSTFITECIRDQFTATATNIEQPTYNPGGLSHDDINKSFSDVWDIYIEHYADKKGDNTKLGKIKDCSVITSAIVKNTLSEDFRFFDLTPNQYLDICERYVAIPAGIGGKKIAKLSKSEFLALTSSPPKKYKAHNTIKAFLETFNSFIGKMNQRFRGKQSIDFVRVSDILPATHPDKVMKDRNSIRRDISDERIKEIFSHPYFISAKPSHDASYYRSGHFWVPLTCLFTGMRVGECSQLHTSDILQVHGVWCFWINGDVGKRSDRRIGGKRVKTSNSVRYIPIHQTLIDLGLLDYVSKMNELGSQVLFPTIGWTSADGVTDNGNNTVIGSFFRILGDTASKKEELSHENDSPQNKETFHSLRHTFITKMRIDLNMPNHEIAMNVGHLNQSEEAKKDREVMTSHYGGKKGLSESELLKMRNAVNRIRFDIPITREHWQNFSTNKMRDIYTSEQLEKQLAREADSREAAKARKARRAASKAQ